MSDPSSHGSADAVVAPVFGRVQQREDGMTSASDINLNEVFAEFFLMSEFNLEGGDVNPATTDGSTDAEFAPAPAAPATKPTPIPPAQAAPQVSDMPAWYNSASTPASSAAAGQPQPAAGGPARAATEPKSQFAGRSVVTDDAGRTGVSAAAAAVGAGASSSRFEATMRSGGSGMRSVSSLEQTGKTAGGKPRLLPSGFAGIAAIGGGHVPMSAVKTETQPNKKRRRRPDPSELTEEQRLERRERNREHAKRSRIRKKFLLESLQDQLAGLRHDNRNLRHLIRERLPTHATDILTKCMTEESLLLMDTDMKEAAEVMRSENGGADRDRGSSAAASRTAPTQTGLPDGIGGGHQLTEPDYRLMLNLVQAQQNFTVSDPALPDNPIVYASEGFLKLTGYTREQVIGRNCRFLQGPETDQKMVDVIRKSVREGTDTSVCLLNYKADGTPFWNQFFVAALQDAAGNVVNFVGVQCEVNQVPIEIMREHAKQMAVWDI